MKKSNDRHENGFWLRLCATLVIASIIGLPSFAEEESEGQGGDSEDTGTDGGDDGSGDGTQPPGGGAAEETVGTLPVIRERPPGSPGQGQGLVDRGLFDFHRLLFSLRGPAQSVEASIINAYGVGYVVREDFPESGEIKMTFHGDVSVIFDRLILETPGITTDVVYGLDFVGGVAAFTCESLTTPRFELPVGSLAFPVARLDRAGFLSSGPLSMHAINSAGHYERLEFETYAGMLTVTQGF